MSEKKIKNIFVQHAIQPSFICEQIAAHATKTNIGGHSIFLGQIRADNINDQSVTGIEYTCYEEMALEAMHKIREDLFAKYELTCMHVYHSLGWVGVGEISLFVFTSSKHRAPAISACEECVERIKKELPVWGKEVFGDTKFVWKENKF